MPKSFSLSIPEPCHEDWSRMTANEKGRHCAACQKTVVDFSRMSDEQLITMFRKTPDQLYCGRFRNDQLGRDYAIPKKRIPWLKYFFQVTIPAFLLGKEANAQGKPLMTSDAVISLSKPVDYIDTEEPEQGIVVSGKVVDAGDAPVSFASVILKGTNCGAAAGADGTFSMRIDPDFSKQPVLVISAIGFETREILLTKKMLNAKSGPGKDSLTIIYELSQLQQVFSGEIVVVKSRRSKKPKFPTTNDADSDKTDESIITYPNPVLPGGILSVKLKKSIPGNCRYEVIDMNGKEVYTGQYHPGKTDKVFSVQLPFLNPGQYILLLRVKGAKWQSMFVVR